MSQFKTNDTLSPEYHTPKCIQEILDFPYVTNLSFGPFIKHWEEELESSNNYEIFSTELKKRIKSAPELRKAIDMSEVGIHMETIRLMMMTLFPMSSNKELLAAATTPFSITVIHSTERYNLLFESLSKVSNSLDLQYMSMVKYVAANMVIMNKYYGVDSKFDLPVLFKMQDPISKLDKHYNIQLDTRFVDVVANNKPKKLSQKVINELMNNLYDISLWKKHLPWDAYSFEGFAVHTLIDVTDQEVVSGIKDDLLEKDAIILPENLKQLEFKLKSLLRAPDLKMGIIAFDWSDDKMNNYGGKIWNSIFTDGHQDWCMKDIEGSIMQPLMENGGRVLIKDLKEVENQTGVEKLILDKGFRNVFLATLQYDGKTIGLLELASPNPGDISNLNSMKLRDVIALLSISSQRSIDELKNQVQAVIKENYTAIHPSVEWKFVESASKYLQEMRSGKNTELDPIVFKNIYPLYGQSDIRDSSVERSKAIQADLVKLLTLAKNVLNQAIVKKQFPIYKKLLFEVEDMIKHIKSGLSSGDELNVHDFISQQIEPLFEDLSSSDALFEKEIKKYRDAMDSDHGFIYEKRKDYEDSVNKINQVVSDFIEDEERRAQPNFPHYFEKYKTDGVEYTIYTGESLTQKKVFGPLYLQNLRLWQLIMMCEVVRKTNALVPVLKVPLETTHLILVYSAPLSIQFREDEKQFDVEGAYNMRYEIVKKRIDKAHVRDSNERITQPGQITIVYSQYKEVSEYMQYIEYLQHIGYVTSDVEKLDVEELQGVEGLKALRLTVKDEDESEDSDLVRKVKDGLIQPKK